MDPSEFEFLIEQFKALRSEIEHAIQHRRQTLYFTILACSAIWSTILIKDKENISEPQLIAWVPLVLTILAVLYTTSLNSDIKKIGRHIQKVEVSILKDHRQLGWESSMVHEGWSSATNKWEKLFWLIFILSNLFLALDFTGLLRSGQ